MQANPNKFQATDVEKRTIEQYPSFKFGSNDIKCDDAVKLLGWGSYQIKPTLPRLVPMHLRMI